MKIGITQLILCFALVLTGTVNASEAQPDDSSQKAQLAEYDTQFSNTGSASGKILRIQAAIPWQQTGITLHKGQTVIISFLSGSWCVNPAQDEYDANGCPDTPVDSDAYILRLVNEGALCGRIGKTGTPFFIGNTREIIAEDDGELFLTANDDISRSYGAGFSDNKGILNIVIYNSSASALKTDNTDSGSTPEKPKNTDTEIPLELLGDYPAITGFTPQEACRLLIKSISPDEQEKHLKTGKYRYVIWQEPTTYQGTEYYNIKLTEKTADAEEDLEYFLVGANGEIYLRDEIKNGVSTYDLIFNFPELTLHTADTVMLSDPPEGEISYTEAARLLAIKLYLNNSLDITDMTSLSLYYQGIMDYEGSEYYLLGVCSNYTAEKPGILDEYCMNGKGKVLKGIDANEHTLWEPLTVN